MMNYFYVFSRWAQKTSVHGLAVFLALGFALYSSEPTQAQQGVAPTVVPSGGCAIDGNLFSRTPVTSPFSSDNGDFLPNDAAPGSGGYIFTLAGIPVDSTTAFHLIDGYDANDSSIFTGGSKFNDDPNTWNWTTGKPPAKDDINNALFFFSSDTLGNLWFVGSGDRSSTNGNTYLDFELLQNPLYKNPGNTFTSLGPDGGRTIGDLAVTISYTNGGSNAQLFIYQWSSAGQGNFGYNLVTPAEGTTFLVTNKDSAIVVPYGAFGANTYPVSSFTEVACNLNGLVTGTVSCLNIKTVIVKTKASQAFNAELKDFITPVQVNIGSAPVVSVNSPAICPGDSATLTATVVSGAGPYSYLWSTSETTQSITVTPDTTTQYTVTVTGGNGCQSNTGTSTVTVLSKPACFISGPDSICPSGSGQFFGPDSLNSYAWTISGNGTIQGTTSGQMVVVEGSGACDSSFTINLVITGTSGCSSSCSKTINLLDHVSPVITNVPGPVMVQCASQVPPAVSDTVTATDNCQGAVTLVVSDQVTNQTCPNKFTIIRTWTATDLCGNFSAASQTIAVSDTIPPVLEGVPADTVVCCADSIPPPAVVTAFDSCGGQVTVTFNEAISDSTGPNMFILTRTWIATDSCSNIATASQVITVNDTLSKGGVPGYIGSLDGNAIINVKVSPNPFISSTKIQFSVREDVYASVELYNSMGVKLKLLYDGNVSAGNHVTLNLSIGELMEPGVYLLIIRTNHGITTRHVILTR